MLCLKYVSEQERISIKKKIKITLDIMEILELLYENIFCPYNPGAWNLLPFSLPIFTHPPSDHEISDANVGHCTFDSFAFLHPPPPCPSPAYIFLFFGIPCPCSTFVFAFLRLALSLASSRSPRRNSQLSH